MKLTQENSDSTLDSKCETSQIYCKEKAGDLVALVVSSIPLHLMYSSVFVYTIAMN